MKIAYFSQPFFADCDFPLVKEMQSRNMSVRYYMPVGYNFSKSSLLEMEKPLKKWGIYKASKIKQMEKYRDCIDLDSLYFICGRNRSWWPFTWLLWICVYVHIWFYRADILHIVWQLKGWEKMLFYIPGVSKKVMTVHDPLQHSSTINEKAEEKARLKSFDWADFFMLLNEQQVDVFSKTYNIEKNRIFVSKLGVYDSIKYLNLPQKQYSENPYVLYFGQIIPHKGIEYLMEAMLKVNEQCKNVNLLIAGKGKIYFDMTKYADKDFIKIENRYIGISELVGLIRNSLFVVCPYKDATQSGVVQTAFALNVPIVATNVGALPIMVKDGVYGSIVPPCDSDALATAMLDLIDNKEKRCAFKDNIKTQWSPSMSWAPIVDDYVKLYEKK